MRFILLAALILTIVAAVSFGKAQYQHPNSPLVFRGYPVMARQQDSRFFFGSFSFTTFTYTITTTTTTATATTTTTCTTSSTTLTTCTAGRRRREDKIRNPRGLFYEEKEEDVEDSSVFLPAPSPTVEESDAARSSRQLEAQSAIPLAIQPTFGAFFTPEVGYEIPAAIPLSRIFLTFGTATVTVTTTSTTTSKLTATCSSTTGYSLCSS